VARLAVVLLIAFGVLTFVVRVAIQLVRTGRTGLIGIRRAGPIGWLSGLFFVGGMALAVVSVTKVLHDTLEPIDALNVPVLNGLGIVLAVAGGLAVFGAQLGMGASWRVGVSEDQGTDLVTSGWFSMVRNPIYTAMVVGWSGIALMVPTWLGILAVFVIAVGLELQVRAVEEPYLIRAHGDDYRDYATRVGRFVPGIGRLG
jgi:protein-S-isoprenylcysteine O-methyltransferase Ste14